MIGESIFHQCHRHIDCAHLYENEEEVGAGLKYGMEELNIPRHELFVTSKLWITQMHPEEVEKACRKSLKALGLSYLDLYLIHWPHAMKRGDELRPKNPDGTPAMDLTIHPTDTWLIMEKLVGKGLTASIGVSNFNSVQIRDILDKGSVCH